MANKIEYLSPSGIKVFLENAEEFYTQYLSPNRPPRPPQNLAMASGSAFDSYVKSWLHNALFGDSDPRYTLEALLEAQVESQNRQWARENGKYIFDCYLQSGALSDLLLELQRAVGSPRFEFRVQGAIHGYREGKTERLENVILHGRPDCAYINTEGHQIVLDWKVNGYCSKYAASPMPGYLRLRAPGRTNLGMHRDAQPMVVDGLMINISTFLETYSKEWALQLAIYHFLLGSPFCSHTLLVGIDQLCCDATKGALPQIRVAEHRLRISKEYQQIVFDTACMIWEIANSDHFFRDMSFEDSAARCKILDRQLEALRGDGSKNDAWFTGMSRGTS